MRRMVCLMLAVAALTGCRDDLTEQPKFTTYAPSTLWQDGAATRPRVEGTVSRSDLTRAEIMTPPEIGADLLARGRERFDVFCSPCHGPTGAGDGRVVQRGFPQPPSLLSARLRQAPAEHFVNVIGEGYGVMFSYGDRVAPKDRWAITAYIRALQRAAPEVAESHPARALVPVGDDDE